MYVEHFCAIETRCGDLYPTHCGDLYRTHRGADLSTCWISDPARQTARCRVPWGLPCWKESPLMEAGSKRKPEPTVTEAGESEGSPSRAEVNL